MASALLTDLEDLEKVGAVTICHERDTGVVIVERIRVGDDGDFSTVVDNDAQIVVGGPVWFGLYRVLRAGRGVVKPVVVREGRNQIIFVPNHQRLLGIIRNGSGRLQGVVVQRWLIRRRHLQRTRNRLSGIEP